MATHSHQSPTGAATTDLLQRSRNQIEEFVTMVTSIVYGMWRYRWYAVALAWATCIVGWSYVDALPNVYEARTRIYIDARSMIKRVIGDLTLTEDLTTEINVLTRILLSQPQLEKVARVTELDLRATTPKAHEDLINSLRSRIGVSRENSTDDIFSISFRDENRETAGKVVTTLLSNFMEDALGERRTDSGAASEFLEQQITEYERRLNEAEKRLADFKRENIGLMPGETGDYFTRQQAGLRAIEGLRADLTLAEQRRTEYQNQLRGEEPVFGLETRVESSSSVDATVAQYEADLNNLLLKYTENHPDVIALRETIDRLKAKRGQELVRSAPATVAGADALDVNPVYQRMKIGRSEAEVDVVTIKAKLATAEATYRELQQKVVTIPDVERQLSALNRDYSVTQAQYETLLQRRESLRITGQVEESSDQLQFRIIDPPHASLSPVGPDRGRLLAAATAVAIGLGGALAFLLQQLNPVFNDRRQLRDILGLPVLGAVSLAQTPELRAQSRRQKMVFAAASAALPALFVLALVLQDQAHELVNRLLSVLRP